VEKADKLFAEPKNSLSNPERDLQPGPMGPNRGGLSQLQEVHRLLTEVL
jgi:hypothetical protein